MASLRKIYDHAVAVYATPSDDDVELDDFQKYAQNEPCARVSRGDGGTWIQAWVWVNDEDVMP